MKRASINPVPSGQLGRPANFDRSNEKPQSRKHTADLTRGFVLCAAMILLGCSADQTTSRAEGDASTPDAATLPELSDNAAGDGGAFLNDTATPASPTGTKIGPEGGTLSITGLTLVVPPGALAQPTTVRAEIAASGAPTGYLIHSPRFRLSPAGLRFAIPATVTIDISSQQATDIFWTTLDEATQFAALPNVQIDSDHISAEVAHFSEGFAGALDDAVTLGPNGTPYRDCNGDATDGRETPVNTLNNCGTCGTPCSLPKAVATCQSGSCEVASCQPGWGNCQSAAGCETQTATSQDNCGKCGLSCDQVVGDGHCSDGECIPSGCPSGQGRCGGSHCVALTTFYADSDDDGYGDPDNAILACTAPAGHLRDSNDCDDQHATSHPGAPEICDGLDNDCNDTVDDSAPARAYCEALPGTAQASCQSGQCRASACDTGYTNVGGTCVDLDECTLEATPCGGHGQCVNLPGTYSCQCASGYRERHYTVREPSGPRGQLVDVTRVTCSPVATAIAAGGTFGCALDSEQAIECWGLSAPSALTDPATAQVVELSAGSEHACARQSSGKVYCWGGPGGNGQYGFSSPASVPSELRNGNQKATTIAAGGRTSCAATAGNNAITCWGYDALQNIPAPTGLGGIQALAADDNYRCVITASGSLHCWTGQDCDYDPTLPDSRSYQCRGGRADNEEKFARYPASIDPFSSQAIQISGSYLTKALVTSSGGVAVLWRHNASVDAFSKLLAGEVPANKRVVAADAGFATACAVLDSGSVVCRGTGAQENVPADLGNDITAISVGRSTVYVLRQDGSVDGWTEAGAAQTTPASGIPARFR